MNRSKLTTTTRLRRGQAGKRLLVCALAPAIATTSLLATNQAFAQEGDDLVIEEVVVTGIRGSLQSALKQKRNADNLIEVIEAQDIGKLPDQNLAEVLELSLIHI